MKCETTLKLILKATLGVDQPLSFRSEIEELPGAIQEQLFSELLDRDAQQTLEAEPPLINWSHELTVTLGTGRIAHPNSYKSVFVCH